MQKKTLNSFNKFLAQINFFNKIKHFLKLPWMFTFCITLSCQYDEFPMGLYDYQVERLLHGGARKVWKNNEEGVWNYLLFQSIDDSVNVMGISIDFSDTISLGMMKASVKSMLFSDTLLFSDGGFWLIEEVSSHTLLFKEEFLELGKLYNWHEIE
tara:strand:- start:261 stop:725 length:465 start_codon:yes stop_codon:yes gene_type:complete